MGEKIVYEYGYVNGYGYEHRKKRTWGLGGIAAPANDQACDDPINLTLDGFRHFGY